ncbi:hypothetical protein ACU4GD_22815, partial [Cupriavidus basilensis]
LTGLRMDAILGMRRAPALPPARAGAVGGGGGAGRQALTERSDARSRFPFLPEPAGIESSAFFD